MDIIEKRIFLRLSSKSEQQKAAIEKLDNYDKNWEKTDRSYRNETSRRKISRKHTGENRPGKMWRR